MPEERGYEGMLYKIKMNSLALNGKPRTVDFFSMLGFSAWKCVSVSPRVFQMDYSKIVGNN